MAEPYNVHITTTADESGAKTIKQDIREIREESDALNAGGTAGPGLSGEARLKNEREIAELNRRQEQTMRELLADQDAVTAKEAERIAIEERRVSLTTQRQIIADIELEQAEAAAAGETQRAAALEIQLNIRRQALALQTSANLSEEEATAIATRRVALEAQITFQKELQNLAAKQSAGENLLAGANLGKARQEATTLARELLTGGNSTRTLGSLLGSLGPAILPILGSAATLYATMIATNKVAQEAGKLFGGFSFGDLAGGFNPEAIAREITAADQLKQKLHEIDNLSFEQLSSSLDKGREKLTELTDKYREELAKDEGVLEPIRQKHAEILESIRAQIEAQTRENELLEFERNIKEATATIEAMHTAEIERRHEARERDIDLQKQGSALDQAFREGRASELSGNSKLDAYRERIAAIKTELQGLGASATSPAAAYSSAIGKSEELHNSIVKLATEWQKLSGEERSAAVASAEQTAKLGDQTLALGQNIEALRARRTQLLLEIADSQTSSEQRAKDIQQLRALDQIIGKMLDTQHGAPGANDQGLEKWLIDTAREAGLSEGAIIKLLTAVKSLYSGQSKPATNKDAPFGGDPKNYIMTPNGPSYVAPAGPGQGKNWGFTDPFSDKGFTDPFSNKGFTDPFSDKGFTDPFSNKGFTDPFSDKGFGPESAPSPAPMKKSADAAAGAIQALHETVSNGFDSITGAVKESHGALQRQIEQHTTDIANLARNKAERNS
jgi:hypothetical protein